MSDKYYIYGSMTDRSNRTECVSLHDVTAKFKEVIRVYRQRGATVVEGDDLKWSVTSGGGESESLWIEDAQGHIVKATDD